MQKWDPKEKQYHPYQTPKVWNCMFFSNDMNAICNCARCGRELPFGDTYTSRLIHTNIGFGYGVCETCYGEELQEEFSNEAH